MIDLMIYNEGNYDTDNNYQLLSKEHKLLVDIYLNGKTIKETLIDSIEKTKDRAVKLYEEKEDDSEQIKEIFDSFLEKKENIMDNIDGLIISNDIDIQKLYKENPEFIGKRVLLKEKILLNDFETLENTIKKFDGIDAYANITGNTLFVSLEECKLTMEYIKEIAQNIKNLNLSPFETIIYVYDIVRDRNYKHENEYEEGIKSRELSEIKNGDAIVCVGFSALYSAILEYLGIEAENIYMNRREGGSGHVINEIYIKDPKYKIDNVYYFDATKDCKKSEFEEYFLLSYYYFAQTRDEIEDIENNKYLFIETPLYSKNMLDDFEKVLIETPNDKRKIEDYTETINKICDITKSNFRIEDNIFSEGLDYYILIKDKLKKVIKKYNKTIPAETYIDAINYVRKIQYYQDPQKYPYSLEVLNRIFYNSNWKFKKHHISDKDRLLNELYSNKKIPKEDVKYLDCRGYLIENIGRENTKRFILTRTLKSVLENKMKR